MDFARALTLVATFLERENASYAVIGGVALAAYGSGRVRSYFERRNLERDFDENI